ncbi:glyoxalase/bleomycin resistance/extradiol dioxygenase family protein [Flavobacterium faecale]|uniref:Glyoxalase/bleomycin resistance/extradiol dioxygenase family protein n=1 Tax=Flavobacterium faecale TaxID=1355330 RepID=A0A2S1LE50_9FLAO|nr:VOC family protein [Flavobacterium faecale]AWG21997.1 glyoxalase/bleomycin resistance/extradiol dioxygenase family protein [Flavobacterium faecale]
MNLNQITIPVLDVEKSIEFYQKLGLKLIVHSTSHYARFVCPEGEATFSLHQSDDKNQGSGIWIYFEIENLDQKVDDLIKQGFIFEELPNDKPWLWREARLKDLDDNQLLLYYAGENRVNPPWKIK